MATARKGGLTAGDPTWFIENQLGLPVYIETVGSTDVVMTLVYVLRFAFNLAEVFTEPDPVERAHSRSLGEDQAALYRQVEASLGSAGVEGRECLLKAVCEAQTRGLLKLNLLGHMLTAFLSPVEDESAGGQAVGAYWRASDLGRGGADCALHFPACPISIMDIFKFGKKKVHVRDGSENFKSGSDISKNGAGSFKKISGKSPNGSSSSETSSGSFQTDYSSLKEGGSGLKKVSETLKKTTANIKESDQNKLP